LAIVAAIVAAHNGSVEVFSEPGAGATFRVSLPALEPDKSVEAEQLSFIEDVRGQYVPMNGYETDQQRHEAPTTREPGVQPA
jgi:nitrogen-specific signal transduction histidine kinase